MERVLKSLILIPPASHVAASNGACSWMMSQLRPSGLIDSYENASAVGYTYDQAVAVIAFLAHDHIAPAQTILDTLKQLQHPDGSWNTAYYCGAREVNEPRRHIGPTLWVVLAAAHYERKTGDKTTYGSMALNAIDWCLKFQQPDGGINGGIDDDGSVLSWCSTEHNEDAYAALSYFGYHSQASKVKHFLDNTVWNAGQQRWLTGRNDSIDMLDVNTWGVAALGGDGNHHYAAALDYAMSHHRSVQHKTIGQSALSIDGFDYNSDKNDIWFEGQSQMALAFKLVGREDEANYFIDEIIKVQNADGGNGVRYSLHGTPNGYWTMAHEKSVAASGWLIFAVQRVNPFQP